MDNRIMLVLALMVVVIALLMIVLGINYLRRDVPASRGSFTGAQKYRAFKDGKPLAFSATTPRAVWTKVQKWQEQKGLITSVAALRQMGFTVKLLDEG